MDLILADSQTLVARGVCEILKNNNQYKVAFHAKSKQELLSFLENHTPATIIIDPCQLNDFSISDLIRLTELFPVSRILVLTNNSSAEFILKTIETGISHFILKTCTEEELMTALDLMNKNEKYLCNEALKILLNKQVYASEIEDSHLTKKELEIIQFIAQGLTNKEIAEKAFLSIHTIQTHRKNIFKKLNINNTSELLMFAVKKGIIDTTEYYI